MLGVRGFRVGGLQGLRVLGLIKAQGSGSLANVQTSTPQRFEEQIEPGSPASILDYIGIL